MLWKGREQSGWRGAMVRGEALGKPSPATFTVTAIASVTTICPSAASELVWYAVFTVGLSFCYCCHCVLCHICFSLFIWPICCLFCQFQLSPSSTPSAPIWIITISVSVSFLTIISYQFVVFRTDLSYHDCCHSFHYLPFSSFNMLFQLPVSIFAITTTVVIATFWLVTWLNFATSTSNHSCHVSNTTHELHTSLPLLTPSLPHPQPSTLMLINPPSLLHLPSHPLSAP